MRLAVRFFVGCVLLFFLFHVAAAAVVAYSHGTSFVNGNHIVLDACLSGLACTLFSGFPYTLEFLQCNHLPPLPMFVTIVAAVFSQFCRLLASITTIVFTNSRLLMSEIICEPFERWLDQSNLIGDLQRELDTLDDPVHVQQLRDDNHMFKKQLETSESKYLESDRVIKDLRDTCSLKEQRIRHLEGEIEELEHRHRPGAASTTERQLRSEIAKSHQAIAKLEEEKADVEESLNRAKLRLSGEQWGAEQRKKLERKHKIELQMKQDEIDSLAKLKGRSIFERPPHIVTISRFITTAVYQLTYTSSEHRQAIAYFLEVTLKESGIDPREYVVWPSWTQPVPEGHGTLSPQIPSIPQPLPPDFTELIPASLSQGSAFSNSVPVFGQTSSLGQASVFSNSAPVFGQPSTLGQASAITKPVPVFGQTSSLGQTSAPGPAAIDFRQFLAPPLAPAVAPESSAGNPSG